MALPRRHLTRMDLSKAHLVLCQKREMQQNLDGLSVSGHHNKLTDASIQGLGGCKHTLLVSVGALPQLLDHSQESQGWPCMLELPNTRLPSLAPLRSCLYACACWTMSKIVVVSCIHKYFGCSLQNMGRRLTYLNLWLKDRLQSDTKNAPSSQG
jgi:hypothetical protein